MLSEKNFPSNAIKLYREDYITKIKALILLSRVVQGVSVYVFQILMCDWNSFRNS